MCYRWLWQNAWLSEGNEDHGVKGRLFFNLFKIWESWVLSLKKWPVKKDVNCKRENINNFQCKNLALNIMGLGSLGLRNNLKQEKEQPFIWDKNKWMSVDLEEKWKMWHEKNEKFDI